MDLQGLREEIDSIDYTLLEVIAKRLTVSSMIGEFKKRRGMQIRNRKRELLLIEDRSRKFKELGFNDPDFVAEIFELLMKKSRKVQSDDNA